MTNRVNPVFLAACLSSTSMIWLPPTVCTSTLALAPSRQSLATADWERTILKEVSSTAKAAAANKAAISSAAPTASTTRLIVLFVLTFFFLSWSLVHSSLASSIDRRSWRERWRKPGVALPVHLPPPLWACLHKQMVSPLGTGGLLLSVSCGLQSILCCSAPRRKRGAPYSRNTPRKGK